MKLQEYVGLKLVDKATYSSGEMIAGGQTKEITLDANRMYILIGWGHVAVDSISFYLLSTYGAIRFYQVLNTSDASYRPSYSANGLNLKITSPKNYRSNYILLKIS